MAKGKDPRDFERWFIDGSIVGSVCFKRTRDKGDVCIKSYTKHTSMESDIVVHMAMVIHQYNI